MPDEVQRRLALVTGASSGIGLELARLLAAEGCDLALVARRRDRLEALKSALEAAHPVRASVIVADLAEREAPARIMERVAELGPLHTLVNNAGFGIRGMAATIAPDRQLEMIDVNVRALAALTFLALPGMVSRRQGAILNVGSLAGFVPGPGMAAYYATKAFVLSFSEGLAEEVRPQGISVTALCPGPVETEFEAVAGRSPRRDQSMFEILPADMVARVGLEALRAGKAVVVPGRRERLVPLLPRFLPRGFVRRLVGRSQGVGR